ncbi:hypothetical protein DUNSADRAFT_18468 [Dunaliella salina]|uniref:Uncharacterized protein n=1 Tax=Dunaliella salina TaxID=3046 RepID=A0ABQ7G026_DUNSA|nr:hypothetical protein DUNSADRAFT_18468 [Dunaliella salina]|eukprot:KAF5827957.1 hypothetical protein DUNSADRAFT_18468 [Dunaliella salina]
MYKWLCCMPTGSEGFFLCSIWASDPCAFFKIIKTLASPSLFTLLPVLMAQFACCLLNSCDNVRFNFFAPWQQI